MTSTAHPISDPSVQAAFDAFPTSERAGLLHLRDLIVQTAATTDRVGPLLETLKWGQPSYLTSQTKSGTTLRLGLPKTGGFAIYVHCQTTLISEFQSQFPDDFRYEGNRAVHFATKADVHDDKIRLLITHALTYHI